MELHLAKSVSVANGEEFCKKDLSWNSHAWHMTLEASGCPLPYVIMSKFGP